jgi:hypothetical protein
MTSKILFLSCALAATGCNLSQTDIVVPTGGLAFGLANFTSCTPADTALVPSGPFEGVETAPELRSGVLLVQVELEVVGLGAATRTHYPAPNLGDRIASLFVEAPNESSIHSALCGSSICGIDFDLLGGGTGVANEEAPNPPPITAIDPSLLAACPQFSANAIVPSRTAGFTSVNVVTVSDGVATRIHTDLSGDSGRFTPPSVPVEDIVATWAPGFPE